MKTMPRNLLVFVITLIAAAGALSLLRLSQNSAAPPAHATIWPGARPLPSFSLIDQDGESIDKAFFKDRWSLLFFGFTFCPDICPATLQQLALAQRALDEDGKDSPDIVLVSVDPERDSPEALKRYVGNFGERTRGITGSLEEITKVTAAAGVFFAKSPLDDGGYTVDHSTVVLLINPRSEIHASFSAPHSVEHFVADLPGITGSP